ncbi:MAG: 3-hydroxyacyl-CoA dehydrogenase family protein [Deltaproteobacteria bacterium]|nr:3-hydroxyacyl-CoA dehydrogenase family protein [Deltaproteobacteria bacterium]
MKKIEQVGVVGAGTMGRGIAQVFALHDYQVTLIDRDESILEGALEKVRERTPAELWDKVKGLIRTSTDIKAVKDCDIVIEAVFEEMGVKKEIFKALNGVCKKDAVIASNTSALSITELSGCLDDPSRFIGMHFMNPPKVMKLVEVEKGEKTSKETLDTVVELARKIEKVPAVVNDSPGFISNRLLFALIGEALRLLERGVAGKEDIDTVMKYGMNHPMGPIELADFMGLDICLDIMKTLYKDLNDERYKPTRTLESLVKAGKLGRKTKEGFYRYE